MRSASKIIIVALLICGIGSCSEERNQIQPRNPQLISLNYDSDNVSAPTLEPGAYEGAARFSADQISQLNGSELIEIQYFIALVPDVIQVKVYGGDAPDDPGILLYSAEVTAETQAASWNTHQLATPVTLSDEDIWISVAFGISSQRATLGCDAGPAFVNGDWLYDDSDGAWIPFSQRTSIDINWNIRAILSQ